MQKQKTAGRIPQPAVFVGTQLCFAKDTFLKLATNIIDEFLDYYSSMRIFLKKVTFGVAQLLILSS